VNRRIKINNKKVKLNNKTFHLKFVMNPILGGEYELDSYNGKNLIAEEYQDTVFEVHNIVKQLRNSYTK
jgi:predicted secreted protein